MTTMWLPSELTTLETVGQRFGLNAQALARIRTRLERADRQRGIDRTGQALYPLDAVKWAILEDQADQRAQRGPAAA